MNIEFICCTYNLNAATLKSITKVSKLIVISTLKNGFKILVLQKNQYLFLI